MTDAIVTLIGTLATGAVAIVVCMINNSVTRKAAEEQHNTTIALIEYKLTELTHKVELHNNAVERLYELEKVVGIQGERQKVANHRIEDIEKRECD